MPAAVESRSIVRAHYANAQLDDDQGALDLAELDVANGFGVQIVTALETQSTPLAAVFGFEIGGASSDLTAAEVEYRAFYGGVEIRSSKVGPAVFGQLGLMSIQGELSDAGALNGDDSAIGPYFSIGAEWAPQSSSIGGFLAYRFLTPEPEAFGESISSTTLQVGLSFFH